MVKKILVGLLIFVLLLIIIVGIYYWRMTEKNKPPVSDEDRARLTVMPLPAKADLSEDELTLTSFQLFL